MATAQLIDLSNYDSLLVQSSQSRSGTPDGNIYFNTATGEIELITKQELAQVNLGSGLEDNPLDDVLGIQLIALYAFEKQERVTDESLRTFNRWFDAKFKFAGSVDVINSRKFAGSDRAKVRGSGWVERAADGGVDRIYFGGRSLGTGIQSGSQPYYQLSSDGAPSDFAKTGPVDEAVQVYGSTGNTPSDATAGDFDTRTFYAMSVRSFGYNYDRKTLDDSGLSQADGYAAGFALDESPHLTTGNYTLADVLGGSQVAPWTGMSLEKLASAQSETGFVQADGNFTWVLHNTQGGTLDECVAFLDALAQSDTDIDSGALTTTYGKRVDTWYTYDAEGRILTRSGADSLGLFIENVPASDAQRVVFTDDAAGLKTRPFKVQVEIDPGANALADPNAWYHAFYLDGAGSQDFNTANAVTVIDELSNPIKGNVQTDAVANKLTFTYDYDADTSAGLAAGVDKDIVVLVEGDGVATQQSAVVSLTRTALIKATVSPGLETNV